MVVIIEFLPEDEAIKIDLFCRNNKIGFIYTTLLGIYGFCFVDFDGEFLIKEENREDPLSYCIKLISKEKKELLKLILLLGK